MVAVVELDPAVPVVPVLMRLAVAPAPERRRVHPVVTIQMRLTKARAPYVAVTCASTSLRWMLGGGC